MILFVVGVVVVVVIVWLVLCGWCVDIEGVMVVGEISDLLGGVLILWLLVDDVIVFCYWDWIVLMWVVCSVVVMCKLVVKLIGSCKFGYWCNWLLMVCGDLVVIVLLIDVVYGDGILIEDLKLV